MELANQYKEEFIRIYKENIHREGADELLSYLEKSDFFVAPSSSRFHSAFEGGLCLHSINVFNRLVAALKLDNKIGENGYNMETVAIVSLLHDLCKVNYYVGTKRNKKQEDGTWIQVDSYSVNEVFPYGHGEKSVWIIMQFMKLSAEESLAINWHMGGFDLRVQGGSYQEGEAYSKYPLCVYLQVADMMASYLDETR